VSFICNTDNCWLNVGDGNGSIQEVAKFVCSEKESWRPLLPANSVPSTWTNLTLSRETFLRRYSPGGKRAISLDKAKVELFGANADPQGVVCRVITFDDNSQTIPVEITEIFCPSQRADSMIQRTRHPLSNNTHEHFDSSSPSITERFRHAGKTDNIKFSEFSRADGLVERQEVIEENGSVITERFLHRADGLARRQIYISLLQKFEKKSAKNSDLFPSPGVSQAIIEQIA
jgi:hypothetical protein